MSDVKTNHESETLRCYKSALCVFSHSGHIFQNNGIMVKSTIATELMAILYRSHSTDGCVVTSIFTWGAACCRGHQQVVIYPFGAGLSNVTFHYLPCLVSSRCSDLFFFFSAEIFNYLPPLMRFCCQCRHSAGCGCDSASSAFCEPLSTGWFKNVVSIWGTFDVQPLISPVNRSLLTSVVVYTPWI